MALHQLDSVHFRGIPPIEHGIVMPECWHAPTFLIRGLGFRITLKTSHCFLGSRIEKLRVGLGQDLTATSYGETYDRLHAAPKALHFRPRGAKPKTEHSIALKRGGLVTLGYSSSAPRSPDKAQQRVGILFKGFTPTRGVIEKPQAEA